MYQIDLCEEVLASAPNNTSLHGINMWKITLCFVELVRLCWGGWGKNWLSFTLLYKLLTLAQKWKIIPWEQCFSFHRLSFSALSEQTNHCNPKFSRGVPCPSYPNQLHLWFGLGSAYQLRCSKESKETPSTKSHPRLSIGSCAQALPQGWKNVLHIKLGPSWPLSYLSISFPIRIAGYVMVCELDTGRGMKEEQQLTKGRAITT